MEKKSLLSHVDYKTKSWDEITWHSKNRKTYNWEIRYCRILLPLLLYDPVSICTAHLFEQLLVSNAADCCSLFFSTKRFPYTSRNIITNMNVIGWSGMNDGHDKNYVLDIYFILPCMVFIPIRLFLFSLSFESLVPDKRMNGIYVLSWTVIYCNE